MTIDVPGADDVPIVRELAKLIKLNGESGPTTLAKFNSGTHCHRLSLYMSWDNNGELKIE